MPAPNRILPVLLAAVLLAGAGCLRPGPEAPAAADRAPAAGALDAGEAARRLAALRVRIDSVDAAMVRLIGARLAIAREVGAVKHAAGMPVVDTAREAVVVERFARQARAHGVDEAVAADVIRRLILAARAQQ